MFRLEIFVQYTLGWMYNKLILNQTQENYYQNDFYIILHCSFNLLMSGIPSGPRFIPGAISSIISDGG
jgi:hypothetical protein